ncbi:ABC transporter ATP-binding protein [Clostridium sediminicola]|uniref:ABC transporter ATP-binding protein n=1 Tax=Clostridium sediminicola TaxID=3114879 RepID=UPI0031F25EA7
MIKIKNVSKSFKQGIFNNFLAVDDVTIEVKEGTVFGIAGNSGCGKSSLARIIVGLLDSSKGSIEIDSRKIQGLKRKEISRQIQIIFQHPESSLDPKMKIKDSLLEPMRINGLYTKEESERRIRELIALLSLKDTLFDRYPHQISGGEAQRVAIARALSLEPKIIVFDEPTSMLDVSTQASILKLLKELQNKLNLTYIIISHDLEVLSKVCDHIAIMNKGRIVDKGRIDDIMKNPKSSYTKKLIENFEFFN